jgi:hypothetical protein
MALGHEAAIRTAVTLGSTSRQPDPKATPTAISAASAGNVPPCTPRQTAI